MASKGRMIVKINLTTTKAHKKGPRKIKRRPTAVVTNSLRATLRGVETVPLEGMVRRALKVCKTVRMDSAHFLKLSSAAGTCWVDILFDLLRTTSARDLYVYALRMRIQK